MICPKITNVVFALLIGSSFGLLVRASKLMLIITGFNIFVWSCLYANIFIDGSFVNWDWALQAIIAIMGMLALAYDQ